MCVISAPGTVELELRCCYGGSISLALYFLPVSPLCGLQISYTSLDCVFTSLNWLCFKPTPCSFILSGVLVCCDWLDLGHVPLLYPGTGSVGRNSQRRASGQPGRISPLIYIIPTQASADAGWECPAPHSWLQKP